MVWQCEGSILSFECKETHRLSMTFMTTGSAEIRKDQRIMERNPNQTHIPVSDCRGPASEQQPPSGSFTDRKEGSDQYNGYPPYQPSSQVQQQHQPAYRDQQPSGPPPRWVRALVRLILESSLPC